MSTDRVRGYAREEAMRFGTTAACVLSNSHEWEDIAARKCVIRRLHADGFSMSRISKWLGYKDHSTVSYHLSRVDPQPQDAAA